MKDTSQTLDLGPLVEDGSIDTVIVAFPDHYGRLMGKRVPADYFLEQILDSEIHACDYLLTSDMELEPLPGFDFSSWDSGYGDMVMKPDPATMRLVPWLEGSALVLCNLLHEDGKPIEQSPRRILERQIEACRQQGFFLVNP